MIEGILTAVGMIAAAVCIIYLSYWFTKRVGAGFSGAVGSRNLKIIESLQVGPNRNVTIVRAGDRYYLIGITQQQITCLAELGADELSIAEGPPVEHGSPFQNILEQYERLRPKIKEKESKEQKEVGK